MNIGRERASRWRWLFLTWLAISTTTYAVEIVVGAHLSWLTRLLIAAAVGYAIARFEVRLRAAEAEIIMRRALAPDEV